MRTVPFANPSDVRRTYEAVSAEVRELAGAGRLPVLLGGDHSITLAGVAGVAAAGGSDLEGLGVVHVDHHFDFGDWSRIHGPIYHGSNSRRIAELPGMEPRNFLFVGVGGMTRRSQLGHLHERGFGIVTAGELRRDGPGGRLAHRARPTHRGTAPPPHHPPRSRAAPSDHTAANSPA